MTMNQVMNLYQDGDMGQITKKEKHKRIVRNYESEKSKELERLASKMLQTHEQLDKLREKKIKGDFLDLF